MGDIVAVSKPEKPTLKYVQTWSTRYRGVHIEIVHHSVHPEHNPHGIGCYYIHLDEDSFKNKKEAELFFLSRNKVEGFRDGAIEYQWAYEKLDAILDFHCGITYYDIRPTYNRKDMKPQRVAVIGCDYAHYWDEGRRGLYDEKILLKDAMATVDQFHTLATYLVWSSNDGVLREEKDVRYTEGKSQAWPKDK